jgi:hypothetical protein
MLLYIIQVRYCLIEVISGGGNGVSCKVIHSEFLLKFSFNLMLIVAWKTEFD